MRLEGELEAKQKKIIERKNQDINQLKDGIKDYSEQLIKKQDIIKDQSELIEELNEQAFSYDKELNELRDILGDPTKLDIPKMEAELWCTLISQGKLRETADKVVGEFLDRFGPNKKQVEDKHSKNFVGEVAVACEHNNTYINLRDLSVVCRDCGEPLIGRASG